MDKNLIQIKQKKDSNSVTTIIFNYITVIKHLNNKKTLMLYIIEFYCL